MSSTELNKHAADQAKPPVRTEVRHGTKINRIQFSGPNKAVVKDQKPYVKPQQGRAKERVNKYMGGPARTFKPRGAKLKKAGSDVVPGSTSFITIDQLREASKRYCAEHGHTGATEALKAITAKQEDAGMDKRAALEVKVDSMLQKRAGCSRSNGRRAKNRAAQAKKVKDLRKQASILDKTIRRAEGKQIFPAHP